MALATVGTLMPGARNTAPAVDERQKPRQVADALRSPEPVTTSTPVNPMQSESYGATKDALGTTREGYGAAKDLAEGITKGTNEEINRELGRARDEISVGIGKEGNAAMARGADPSLFRSRAVDRGARELGNLQGRLADVALDKRQAAINAQNSAASNVAGAAGSTANAAQAAASEQRSLSLGTAAQRLADQRELRERAESQARLDAAPYERLMSLMNLTGQYGSQFGGLSSTGSPLTGPNAGATGPSVPLGPFSKPSSGAGPSVPTFGRIRV